jgi:hypothetical protein
MTMDKLVVLITDGLNDIGRAAAIAFAKIRQEECEGGCCRSAR